MSTRHRHLSKDEIARAFAGTGVPATLSPGEFATLLRFSVKTVYQWLAQGRFEGAYRKRGKHVRLWRDRALQIFFNGPEWKHG